MAALTVTFDVPAKILKGLAEGELKRQGGVIYHKTGGVVAWLREGGAANVLRENAPLGLDALSLGLQVTTLAVNIAGFSLLYAKLKNVQRQLKGIEDLLAQQQRDGEWRDWKEMVGRFVPVLAHVDTLNGIHLVQAEETRRAITVSAAGEFGTAKEYFHHVVTGMIGQRREMHRMDEFEASYRAWVLASNAHVRAAAGLDGNLAISLCSSFLDSHREFDNELRAAIGDYTRALGASESDRANDPRKMLHELAAQVHEIFGGYEMQLKWEVDNGVRSLEFEPDRDRVERHDGVIVFEVEPTGVR